MARPAPEEKAAAGVRRLQISGSFDPHTVELLQLELRRLAARHRLEITSLRTLKADRVRKGRRGA